MAGSVAKSSLSPRDIHAGGLIHSIAGPADADDIVRLQSLPMDGRWLRLALSSRPDYWRAAAIQGEHGAVLIRRPNGALAGMCARSVRNAYIDGEVRALGYFGELRVADPRHPRPRLFRDGYTSMRHLLHEPHRTPYYLTAIAEGNDAAIRLLTSGLAGIPTYRPIGTFNTLAVATGAGSLSRVPGRTPVPVEQATRCDLDAIVRCLARNHARYQFAPAWSAKELASLPGLQPEDFLIVRRGGEITACLALWDQRSFKQVTVAGYAPRLARWRRIVNLAAPLTGMPRLPPEGSVLAQAFLSHVAADGDDPGLLIALIAEARRQAHARGLDLVLIGLADANPMLQPVLQAVRARIYRSKLFLVHWTDGAQAAARLAARVPHPEAAIL